MPFAHEVDRRKKLVTVRGSGAGSIPETVDSLQRLLNDVTLNAEYRFLFVVSHIALEPTLADIELIGECLHLLGGKFPRRKAIVNTAKSRSLPAALVALQADSTNQLVRSFFEEEAARAWLLEKRND